MQDETNALTILAGQQSWRMDRLSPTTYELDVDTESWRNRSPNRPSDLGRMMRRGEAYRCRVGRGPFFYGATPEEAASAAVGAKAERDAQPPAHQGN